LVLQYLYHLLLTSSFLIKI